MGSPPCKPRPSCDPYSASLPWPPSSVARKRPGHRKGVGPWQTDDRSDGRSAGRADRVSARQQRSVLRPRTRHTAAGSGHARGRRGLARISRTAGGQHFDRAGHPHRLERQAAPHRLAASPGRGLRHGRRFPRPPVSVRPPRRSGPAHLPQQRDGRGAVEVRVPDQLRRSLRLQQRPALLLRSSMATWSTSSAPKACCTPCGRRTASRSGRSTRPSSSA